MAGTGNTSVRTYNLFLDTTVQGGGSYAENYHLFIDSASGINFTSHTLLFSNDSTTSQLFFSFDGVNDHGVLEKAETLQMDFRRSKKIWFRGVGTEPFRFWAY